MNQKEIACLPNSLGTNDSAKSYCHFFILSSLLWMINAPIILTPALEHDSAHVVYSVQSPFQVRVRFCYSHLTLGCKTLTLFHLGSLQMAAINYIHQWDQECGMRGKKWSHFFPKFCLLWDVFSGVVTSLVSRFTMWFFFHVFDHWAASCPVSSCLHMLLPFFLTVTEFQHSFGLL